MLEYINDNLADIEKDMNTNIKKNLKKKKKSLKANGAVSADMGEVEGDKVEKASTSDNESEKSEIKSFKRKRRELSKCATKTLNKHRGAIVLDFN